MSKLWILVGCASLAFACNIEVNEPDDDFDEWDEDSQAKELDAIDVCDPYCLELVECGAISKHGFAGCRDICVADFLENEATVSDGCLCVMDAACNAEQANECHDAPLPGVFPEPESAAGGEGGMSGGGESTYPSCKVDHECKLGEDCVTGACQARCVASCQCDEGLACVDGYCEEPEDPPVTCQSSCDCTSGESCLSGVCK